MTMLPNSVCTPALALLMAALPPAAGAAPTAWHAFDFVVSDRIGPGEERVALLLRAEVEGRKCWLQLDTAIPDDVLWHSPAATGAPPAGKALVRIGDMERTVAVHAADLARLRRGECVVGSVGNAFFEHGTLSLDLAASRFAFTPGAMPGTDPDGQPMHYARTGQQQRRPVLPAVLFDGTPGYLLLDTGSARFGLVATSPAQWDMLTGGRPLPGAAAADAAAAGAAAADAAAAGAAAADAAAVRSYRIDNAMDPVPLRCHDTAVKGTIRMAGQVLSPALVSFCEGKEVRLPPPLSGILGLRALAGYRITLDYVSQRWKLEPGGA